MIGEASDQCLSVPDLKKIYRILGEEAIKKAYKEPEVSLKRIKTKIKDIICIEKAEKRLKDLRFKPYLNLGDYIELELVLRGTLDRDKWRFLKYYRLKSMVRKIESFLNSIFKKFDYVIIADE
ncbi:MAG: hypothetical protein EU529_11480 [Promethearchaeota archaeon]|nr:MAG: hypothetical protein EU529_11480 [Candidatus Lokiarchaeota archaeon]